MPVYRCVVPENSLPLEKRQQIASAFTDIHCGITNAPRSFVHVIFDERAAGQSPHPQPYFVDGMNRAGRPKEVIAQVLSGLTGAFIEISGVPADEVGGRINEGPAKWSMEAGMVLPEPGEEEEHWYAGLHAAAASAD